MKKATVGDNPDDVDFVRVCLKRGMTQAEIAKLMGTSTSTVSRIVVNFLPTLSTQSRIRSSIPKTGDDGEDIVTGIDSLLGRIGELEDLLRNMKEEVRTTLLTATKMCEKKRTRK